MGQGIARRGIVIASNHGETQRDLSWLDFSFLRAISDDSKTILFEEEGNESTNYTVFVRDVDGSPAVPIGEGYGASLSRDKRWALAVKLTEPNHEIWLLPVGPGEPRRLNPPSLAPEALASFLSDGKRVIYPAYPARETGHPPRTWLQDVNGGVPEPVSAEGLAGWVVSPDDKWVVVGKIGPSGVRDSALLSLGDRSVTDISGT